jgi:calcineurin-like phosphoesterase family protein
MSRIWFTSDTHYNHKNIVRGTSEWGGSRDQRTRDFDTLEKHNRTLVQNINALVMPEDILYHLGDWSFGGFGSIQEFRDQLNVGTIHLIYGNHDHHIENNKNGIRSLFASTQHYKRISIAGQEIVMSHYSMRVWDRGHHGAWMLYGHSHGTLPAHGNFKTLDVGVDTNNLKPYSFDELEVYMSTRDKLLIDHHNEKTT